MSAYTHQARATKAFGVTFRSKLEACWAHALDEHQPRLNWEYVDCDWHDFVIHCPWGDMRLEIKPIGKIFVWEAMLRIPVGEVLFITTGEPEGEYLDGKDNQTVCVHRHGNNFFTSQSYGFSFSTWEEMRRFAMSRFSAEITHGRDTNESMATLPLRIEWASKPTVSIDI